MRTIKQEYRKFLSDNFKRTRLRQPLFYSWNYGLRFDLQVGSTDTDQYFKEVTRRASAIFQAAFGSSNEVFIVLMDYKYKRRKIRFSNFVFKQIDNLKNTEVFYLKEKRLYEPEDKFDVRNISICKTSINRINYNEILTAIGNSDFLPRKPRLDNNGAFTNKEVYFINIDKKIIFNMYDDRGLDLISADIEILRPIYLKYNHWILSHDREQMDEYFK